jgi:hypothetical protein
VPTARLKTVAVARARVTRANGETEIHYSAERVPIWEFGRWLKLRKHIRFMKNEDKTWR